MHSLNELRSESDFGVSSEFVPSPSLNATEKVG